MKILNIIFLFLLSTLLFGCMKERELVYSGPAVVEFKNHILGRNAGYRPTGVYANATGTPMTLNSRYVSVNTRGTDSILVQLIGPQSPTDIEVSYTIGTMEVPQSQQNSLFPAVEGTHFRFLSQDNRVTIPANSSSGWILIEPIPGSAESGRNYFLVLDLMSGDQVSPSVNYSRFTSYYRE